MAKEAPVTGRPTEYLPEYAAQVSSLILLCLMKAGRCTGTGDDHC